MSNVGFLEKLPDDLCDLKKVAVNLYEEKTLLQDEINYLKEQIALLLHRKFGKKSEQSNDNQMELFDEPEEETIAPKITTTEVKSHTRINKPSIPKNLPTEQIHYDLDDSEKICSCGKELYKFGEDKCSQLEYIPAKIKHIEHVKAKYSCKDCEIVKTAKMPKQPIPKSIATPGLLSQIITSKYVDHLPLYRQEAIYNRIGINIPRATFSNWVFKCAEILLPLVNILKQKIIASNYVKADETTINVLSEKQQNNYIWVFMTNQPEAQSVVFEYHPSRCGSVASNFLSDFKGYLQTDGFAGYNNLRANENIISLGCLAHARRKFFEITKISKNSGAAHIGLKYISDLYKIESEIKEANLNFDDVYIFRQKKSKPILSEFKAWLDKTALRSPPKSALGKAVAYSLNQWDFLVNYCLAGYLEIDNNAIERMIKPFALGRRNWLFQGNTKGAEASAILYSLVQTCKVNNVDPYEYFRYVLTKIPNIEDNNFLELEKLLPQNFNSPLS